MSTARRHLKLPQSLFGTSTHPTMVTKKSTSWLWMDDSHPSHSMSIGCPIPEIRLFRTLTFKLQGQGQRERSYIQPSILLICFLFVSHQSDQQFRRYSNFKIWPWKIQGQGHEWLIKFNSLSGNRRQRGPYSPYKLCNHSLYIGIIIFPHIDNTQSTDIKKETQKKWGHPLRWLVIGDGNSTSVHNYSKYLTTVGTPYNTAPYITGSNIARLGHGSQNSWSKLWIPVVKSAPVRVIFAWKSVPKKRIHGSSDIYLGTQWKQRHDSPWPNRLDVIVTFLWYDTIRTIGHRDHQSTTKKV